MRNTFGLLVTILTCFKLTNGRLGEIPDRGCVSSFLTSPGDFVICETELCFVFINERPYVFPDPEIAAAPSHPFLCRDHDILYSKLTGLFFDILHGVSKQVPQVRESRCIYAGPNCTFDDTVRFVGDVAKSDSRYRFVAGGDLLFLEHRRTPYTIHSQPVATDTMVVLFRPENARQSFATAWKQVFQPFSTLGWVSLLCYGLLFILGVAIHSWTFSRSRSFGEFVRWFVLNNSSERGVWETVSWNSLRFAVTVFCAILILLYELSVVNFIIQGPDLLLEGISELKTLGLEQSTVVKGSASETILKYATGWDKPRGKLPWVRGSSLEEIVQLVKNKTVKYAVSFESTIANVLHSENLCNTLVAVRTDKKDVGGWYYSSSVPTDLRTNIDKALSNLVLKQLPNQWKKAYGSAPLSCGKDTGAIGYEVLVVLLALTVCPFVLKHLISVALSHWWPDVEHQKSDGRLAVAAAQECDSSSRSLESPRSSFGDVKK